MRAVVFALASLAAACSSESKSAPAPAPANDNGKVTVLGVYPDDFKCESVAPPDELAKVLGAPPRSVDSAFAPPNGVPRPCNYLVDGAAGVEAWTFDIDCRDNYEKTAAALFDQYARGSQDQVDLYNAAVDGGHLEKVDGGPPIKAPEPAREVEVGKKALDHHGAGLIFVDDDAPCYVRVIGPDADRRLALAKLVAQNLTPARAPMTPRAQAK